MKGKFHPANDVTINPSGNESVRDILERIDKGRRRFIQTSMGVPVLAALGGITVGGFLKSLSAAPIPASTGFAGIGFESIPPSLAQLNPTNGAILTQVADRVTVPPGYNVQVLASWGDPIMAGAPGWAPNVSQKAEAQEQQFGMHNDGMHYFVHPDDANSPNTHGLLCVNNEYTHESILHPDGLDEASGGLPASILTIDKIRKSQAAHGVSIIDIQRSGNNWQILRSSSYARRITANTRMKLSGPAAGHVLLRINAYDIRPYASIPMNFLTDGTICWGTVNNCAHGYTPWGTYITCEENFHSYFGWKNPAHVQTKLESRYGFTRDGATTGTPATGVYKWHVLDDRFDTEINPNEPNTFGWKVEIDPTDPDSVPVKRTAMGRFKCESAALATDPNRRIAYYMGDDERNEYIYKFVCSRPWNPDNRQENRDLLDSGTLYVAQFSSEPGSSAATFKGTWIPLVPHQTTVIDNPQSAGTKFRLGELADFLGTNDAEAQAKILIKTRMAADAVGATMMDRPEWISVRPRISGFNRLEVYCTLTNNNRRGSTPVSVNNPNGSTTAGSARPPIDAANPRPDNDYGHIIRWRETGDTVTATTFEWDIFVLCGDTAAANHVPSPKTLPAAGYNPAGNDGYAGNINDTPAGSADFGAPDGLWFDSFGRLWIQTDQAGDGAGDFQKIGACSLLCADPNTKEIRRFLTGPNECEVTGIISTPDGRTMFVGIQHPGESAEATNPVEFGDWPKSQFGGAGGRPRSSVLAITRANGGVIGA